MAQNQRRLSQSAVAEKSGNIGAADPRHFDCDFLFVVMEIGTLTLLQFDLAGRGINQGSHRSEYKSLFRGEHRISDLFIRLPDASSRS